MPRRILPSLLTIVATLVLTMVVLGQAVAQPLVNAVDWASLAPAEQQALAPLRGQWSSLDSMRQRKWLDLAHRLPSMPADERQRVQDRMAQWSRLTPGQRGQARVQFQEAQRWSPRARSDRWNEYQSLAPEARKVLAERWRLEAAGRRESATGSDGAKRNLIEATAAPAAPRQAASPTSVRAPSGATSTPISPRPPTRGPLNAGVPKIAATDAFVDPVTLLPRRGPQGAAVVPVPRTARNRK